MRKEGHGEWAFKLDHTSFERRPEQHHRIVGNEFPNCGQTTKKSRESEAGLMRDIANVTMSDDRLRDLLLSAVMHFLHSRIRSGLSARLPATYTYMTNWIFALDVEVVPDSQENTTNQN